LAKKLARHYNTCWVKEYARKYIDNLTIPYQKHDLEQIAKGQIESENNMILSANKLLICDTDLMVIKIWSEYKYGSCEKWILEEIANRKYDLYLLTYIDIPWEEDPQREHPDKRSYFYKIYQEEMETRNMRYVVIKGNMKERMNIAVSKINTLL
jgi:NadR type nicotinamide-nucleotide adenylyltransferase